MAQSAGAAQPIIDVLKGAYDKVTKVLGDPSEPVHKTPYQMKDLPADNPNRKAWEAAMKFQGPPSKPEAKRQLPRRRVRARRHPQSQQPKKGSR